MAEPFKLSGRGTIQLYGTEISDAYWIGNLGRKVSNIQKHKDRDLGLEILGNCLPIGYKKKITLDFWRAGKIWTVDESNLWNEPGFLGSTIGTNVVAIYDGKCLVGLNSRQKLRETLESTLIGENCYLAEHGLQREEIPMNPILHLDMKEVP